MRRYIWGSAIILACAGVMPAQAAPSRQGNFPVGGTVGGSCVMPQAGPLTLSTVVPANGKLDPGLKNISWTLSGWSCNAGSRLSISARALRLNNPQTSLTPSQSQTVNFTARANGWTAADATVTTGESTALGSTALYTGTPQTQSAPRTGSIIVSVSNFIVSTNKGSSANSAKLVDGAYSATIILTLTPSV